MTNKTQIAELKSQLENSQDRVDVMIVASKAIELIEAMNARYIDLAAQFDVVNAASKDKGVRLEAAEARLHDVAVHCANVEAELAVLRGSAVPVAYIIKAPMGDSVQLGVTEEDAAYLKRKGYTAQPLFTHPAPPVAIRREHAEWSQATFGNVGPIGPLKHLSKEAIEAAEAPDDLSEWADMQFLFWDAQRRAGITDAQIEQAMVDKLAINKTRDWPEPRDGEPRLHVKSADGEGK